MKSLQKVAIFLMIIGLERGTSIIELMDNDEIKVIIPEIRKIGDVSQETHECIRAEFAQFGYEDKMRPSEVLGVIRALFNGSKISTKVKGRF